MIKLLTKIDDVMYYPILIVVLAVAGIYFSFRTNFVQLRLFPESIRAVKEKPGEKGKVSLICNLREKKIIDNFSKIY